MEVNNMSFSEWIGSIFNGKKDKKDKKDKKGKN